MLFAGAARAPVSSASFIIVAGVTAAVALAVFYLLKWKPKLLANLFLMIPTIGAAFFIGVRTLDVVADPLAHPATGARVIATSFPGSMYGAIITPQISMQDAVMQFHCYDSSKTLYARLSYYDLHAYVKTPVMLPDSDHYAILELPNAYLANDSSGGKRQPRYLREQQYVVILPTNNFILFARGLYEVVKEDLQMELCEVLSVNSHSRIEHLEVTSPSLNKAFLLFEEHLQKSQLPRPQVLASAADNGVTRLM